MLFNNKPLHEVTEADVQQLLTNQIEEGKLLDYKRELPGQQGDDKKEFLHDVSSFANTSGGHLVYGVEEKDRIPVAILGIPPIKIEETILRLEAMIRDNIEPRIPSVAVEPIKLGSGNIVLVVRIPQSWASPHMVRLSSKFFARNSAGKYALDVGEIRSAFMASESLEKRIQEFRTERLSRIIGGGEGVKKTDRAQVILHVCPLASFNFGFQIDLTQVERSEKLTIQPTPLGAKGESLESRYIFEGRLLNSFVNDSASESSASSLLFRTGCIETVNSELLLRKIRSKYFEAGIIETTVSDALRSYFELLTLLGAKEPWVVSLSVINVMGYQFQNERLPELRTRPIDRDHLLLPEILVQDSAVPVERSMKPAFDVFWNSFGMSRCTLYDKRGKWIGR